MSKFNFDRMSALLTREKTALAVAVGNFAQNEFRENFKRQSFNGAKWQEVKRRIPGTPAYRSAGKSGHTRAILVGKGSGTLRRAVNVSLKKATFGEILFVVPLPYAEIHNTGGVINNKRAKIIMPKRQFIGMTPRLEQGIRLRIKRYLDKADKV